MVILQWPNSSLSKHLLTALSSMLGTTIDISPPEASLVDLAEFKKPGDIADFLEGTFCRIEFRMQIEDLVDSTILQLYTIDFAKSLYDTFITQTYGAEATAPAAPEPAPTPQPYSPPPVSPMGMNPAQAGMGMPQPGMYPQMGMPQMGMGMPQMGMGMYPPMGMPQPDPSQMQNIQPAQFQSFSDNYGNVAGQQNIGLIMDVPLEVTVELGRTTKSISDILDFAPGTIIALDKIAGEPIDVLVNGKFVAKGEVVVIEENFGIRVTEIIKD